MNHQERELPQPFAIADQYRRDLDWCMDELTKMREEIRLLIGSVELLLRIENERKAKNVS